jgi:N utilization substance protein A
VADLGEQLIAKLHEAGITTVEALADMTPEQLEELPGIGPKTVEKIFVAVNNYYSSLQTQNQAAEPAGEVAVVDEEAAAKADLEKQEKSEYREDVDTGQAYEAELIEGVEAAPEPDQGEVHVHGEEQPQAPEASAGEEAPAEEAESGEAK